MCLISSKAFCSMLFTVSFTFASDIVNCKLTLPYHVLLLLDLVSAPYLSLSNYLLICDVYIEGSYIQVRLQVWTTHFSSTELYCLL